MKIYQKNIDIPLPKNASNKFSFTSPQPDTQDINWFSAQLTAAESHTFSAISKNNFIDSMNKNFNVSDNKNHPLKLLQQASQSANMLDFSQANSALSDYYINNILNAKIIAKVSQGIDRLTNLQ